MLLSVPGKVYARVLAQRLSTFAEKCLCENQNGFRKGRSCMDAIFVLRRLMELSREQHQALRIAFVDFTKLMILFHAVSYGNYFWNTASRPVLSTEYQLSTIAPMLKFVLEVYSERSS